MLILPLTILLLVYRILVVVLGAAIALYGASKFKGSRAKAGNLEAQFPGGKVSVANASIGVVFIALGALAIIAGLAMSPAVTVEDHEKQGDKENIHVIKIQDLPPVKHVEPADIKVADLMADPGRHDGEMVRVRGTVTEWTMKGGGDEYMLFTLEDGGAKVKVFSTKVEFFDTGKEEVTVTGKVVVGKEGVVIDASPVVGGQIERKDAGRKP